MSARRSSKRASSRAIAAPTSPAPTIATSTSRAAVNGAAGKGSRASRAGRPAPVGCARAVMSAWEPSYLALHGSGELGERVDRALALVDGRCLVWPRLEGHRLADEPGLCKVGRRADIASHCAHAGEEDCLRGRRRSGTVFFSGCNLRCVFCQNHDISRHLQGVHVTAGRLASMMLELQEAGCHNIDRVTPEHVVPQILEALLPAIDDDLHLPIVYDMSAYDSLDSLRLMDGIVDVYMPDFKQYYPAGHAGSFPEIDRRLHREEFERDSRSPTRWACAAWTSAAAPPPRARLPRPGPEGGAPSRRRHARSSRPRSA